MAFNKMPRYSTKYADNVLREMDVDEIRKKKRISKERAKHFKKKFERLDSLNKERCVARLLADGIYLPVEDHRKLSVKFLEFYIPRIVKPERSQRVSVKSGVRLIDLKKEIDRIQDVDFKFGRSNFVASVEWLCRYLARIDPSNRLIFVGEPVVQSLVEVIEQNAMLLERKQEFERSVVTRNSEIGNILTEMKKMFTESSTVYRGMCEMAKRYNVEVELMMKEMVRGRNTIVELKKNDELEMERRFQFLTESSPLRENDDLDLSRMEEYMTRQN